MSEEQLHKITLIGDKGSGKTALQNRITNGIYDFTTHHDNITFEINPRRHGKHNCKKAEYQVEPIGFKNDYEKICAENKSNAYFMIFDITAGEVAYRNCIDAMVKIREKLPEAYIVFLANKIDKLRDKISIELCHKFRSDIVKYNINDFQLISIKNNSYVLTPFLNMINRE